MKRSVLFATASLLAMSPAPLLAQVLNGSDLILSGEITQNGGGVNFFDANKQIFNGRACIGPSCDGTEPFEQGPLTLKWSEPDILFADSSSVGGISSNDWRLVINDGSVSKFAVQDIDGGAIPFTIEGEAPDNALFVSENGEIGMGTMLPEDALHIVKPGSLAMILERTGSGAGKWKFGLSNVGVFVEDENTGQVPFRLYNNAPTGSLIVQSDGDVGLGTSAPEGKLHTRGDGTQLVYFESGDGGAVQMRFRSDSQNRRFLAVNNNNQVQTQMQFRDDEILFLGATSADEWLSVSAAGITTMGGTCNVNPCDRTFDPSYFEVEPIEERAAYMWENMHLPAVGPTKAGEPINLTEKTTGMLHELEVAHIYIEQLHQQITEDRAVTQARLDAQDQIIEELRAVLSAQ